MGLYTKANHKFNQKLKYPCVMFINTDVKAPYQKYAKLSTVRWFKTGFGWALSPFGKS